MESVDRETTRGHEPVYGARELFFSRFESKLKYILCSTFTRRFHKMRFMQYGKNSVS
jgi:hypothetical protein